MREEWAPEAQCTRLRSCTGGHGERSYLAKLRAWSVVAYGESWTPGDANLGGVAMCIWRAVGEPDVEAGAGGYSSCAAFMGIQ